MPHDSPHVNVEVNLLPWVHLPTSWIFLGSFPAREIEHIKITVIEPRYSNHCSTCISFWRLFCSSQTAEVGDRRTQTFGNATSHSANLAKTSLRHESWRCRCSNQRQTAVVQTDRIKHSRLAPALHPDYYSPRAWPAPSPQAPPATDSPRQRG